MPAELCADEGVEDHGVRGPNLGLHGIQVVVPIRGPTGEVKFQRPRGMLLREFILEGLFVLALGFVTTDVKEGYGGFFRLGHLADGADIVAEGAILQVGDEFGIGLEVDEPVEDVQQFDFFSPFIGLGSDRIKEVLQEADGLGPVSGAFVEVDDGVGYLLGRPYKGNFVGVLENLEESGAKWRVLLCDAFHLVEDGFNLLGVFFAVAGIKKVFEMVPTLLGGETQLRKHGNVGRSHHGSRVNDAALQNLLIGFRAAFSDKVDRDVRRKNGSCEDTRSGHGAFPQPQRERDGVGDGLMQKVRSIELRTFIDTFEKG